MFRLDCKKENCVKSKSKSKSILGFPNVALIDLFERQACFDNSKGEAMDRGSTVVKSKTCILHAVNHAMGMSEVNVSHALPFIH